MSNIIQRIRETILPNDEDSEGTNAFKATLAGLAGATLGGSVGTAIDHVADQQTRRRINNATVRAAVDGAELQPPGSGGLKAFLKTIAKPQPLTPNQQILESLRTHKNESFADLLRKSRGTDFYRDNRSQILAALRNSRTISRPLKNLTAMLSLPTAIGAGIGGWGFSSPYLMNYKSVQEQANDHIVKHSTDAEDSDAYELKDHVTNTVATTTAAAPIAGIQLGNLAAIGVLARKDDFEYGIDADQLSELLRRYSKAPVGTTVSGTFGRATSAMSPHYSPETRNVNTGIFGSPGIAAHELGHAEQPWHHYQSRTNPLRKRLLGGGIMGITRVAPGMATGTAGLLNTYGDSESAARAATVAATAAHIPLLLEEIDAGRRGMRILRDAQRANLNDVTGVSRSTINAILNARGIRRLTPFMGLPSYLAMAAAPMASYLGRKYLGTGFSEE